MSFDEKNQSADRMEFGPKILFIYGIKLEFEECLLKSFVGFRVIFGIFKSVLLLSAIGYKI